MKHILSTVLAITLLLGLGALAILASPSGAGGLLTASRPAAVALAASNFQGAAAPQAPNASENYNLLAMPLKATNQFTTLGLAFKADGLCGLIGTGCKAIMRWDSTLQLFETRLPEYDDGPNFDLVVGGVYFVQVDGSVGNTVSFIGDVPSIDLFRKTLVGATQCQYNSIMVPLNRSDITTADQLAAAIGGVESVLNWDASKQQFETRLPQFDDGPNFSVKIGYPYFVCMTQGKVWP